jgi:OmpA-OmpF porin, OOP family
MKDYMMINLSKAALLAASISVVALPVHANDAEPTYRAQVDPDMDWPELNKATRKKGAFVPAANVIKITPGMTKKQIYTLLDVPHFTEGLFGVRKWNYILNFYTGTGDEYVTCQYQIRYDSDVRVESTYWQTQSCADLAARLTAPAAPQVVEKIVYVDRPVEKASNPVQNRFIVTFDLASSELDETDIATINMAVDAARDNGSRSISVIGHTDTVADDATNVPLRKRRADRVAQTIEAIARNVGVPVIVNQSTSEALAIATGDEVAEEANRRVIITLNK